MRPGVTTIPFEAINYLPQPQRTSCCRPSGVNDCAHAIFWTADDLTIEHRDYAVSKKLWDIENQIVTAVTSSEAKSVASYSRGRYGNTPSPPRVFCSC